jgi:hypothetical protein
MFYFRDVAPSGHIVEKLIITLPVVKATGSQILVAGFFVIIEGPRLQILPLGFLCFFVGQFGCVAVHSLLLVIPDLILHRASSLFGYPEVYGREDPLYGASTVGTGFQRIVVDALDNVDSLAASLTACAAIDKPVFVYRHETL